MAAQPSPLAAHAARAAESHASARSARRVFARLSAARLIVMALSVGAGLWAFDDAAPAAAPWAALGGLAAFAALVAVHDRYDRRARWYDTIARWHEERGHAIAREWDRIPVPWQPPLDPHHPFAHDLDLFGRASVFQLIGPPGTEAGRRTLAGWLLDPASPAEIASRHAAVDELAHDAPTCERLVAHGRTVGERSPADLAGFLGWAESDPWLGRRRWLAWAVRLLPLATLAAVTAQLVGLVSASWWLATVAAGLGLTWFARRPMEQTLGRASGWEPAIRAYAAWLADAETAPFVAPRLRALQAALGRRQRASQQLARLQKLVALADLRHNALLHFPVHSLTLWDFHVWRALERWQRDNGTHVREWLAALGELETLVSLATLAHDHPDWSRPAVVDAVDTFAAKAIGHPLIPPVRCVRNDVSVGPPGRVLCVTGSNMSGKSTLLRAIGVNAVLAQAGAPVCAASLTMPPSAVYTSLRVVDSLAEGVSFFMAALSQLKRLVEAADGATGRNDEPGTRRVLFLLDEILQGTNSVEREAAVRIVVRHLLRTSAIGAITTHDLGLTKTPELAASGDHVHFRETIGQVGSRPGMTFDYTLRPGVATSRNALALLELVGLADHEAGRAGQKHDGLG